MEEPKPSHAAQSNDLERLLQLTYADKYFLQATMTGFHDMLDALTDRHKEGRGTRHTIAQPNSKELLEISKRALRNGETDIAELFLGKAIRKEKYEDASRERNPEPYYYLAEVLQQKASKETVQLPQRQKFLLQAASLYNFVRNCLKKSTVESEFATNHENVIPGKISDVQVSLILAAEGDLSRCRFNLESKKTAIEQLREESKRELEDINAKYDPQTGNEEDLQKIFIKQAADVKNLYRKIASKIKQLLAEIIQECLEVLGEPPCKYEVILLGSLAREEMTPYSDLEWAILTSSDDEQSKIFFRNLTNLVHLQIINLGETILTCMDIEVLREWFYDDVTPRGLSFDGLLPQASKTPLGNTEDFELIHTPSTMANFQSNFWYNKDPRLGEILLTVVPLDDKRHPLLDEYKMELEKILLEPCDLDSCAHDVLGTRPTRGSCRGLCTLKEDISRYEPHTLGIFSNYDVISRCKSLLLGVLLNYDGKLYDVKKEIYRLTDRVVAGLSKVFGVGDNGSFEALNKLCERNVISPGARDNLASAVAIALKMRLSTYLLAEKQEEAIKAKSKKIVATSNAYYIPREKELFHFFYVSTPLYELLCGFCDDVKNRSEDLAGGMFFSFSDVIKGHMHCRLLNYKAASECYKRALEADPGNVGIQNRLKEIESMFRHSKDDALDTSKLDGLTKQLLVAWYIKPCDDFNEVIKITELSEYFKAVIKNEGISVIAIIHLNILGVLLISQMKTGEAYQCLQRALIMEQTIFGDNPNSHAVVTLALLGGICCNLSMWEEAKFCLERSLKMLPTSDSGDNFELVRSEIYRRLAVSCSAMHNYEQAILYSQKGLDLSIASVGGIGTDCEFLFQMAMTWLDAGEDEKAWQCALKANESLTNAVDVGVECRVRKTYFVAETYNALGKTDEAKLLLHRGLEETQDDPEAKISYLRHLGTLCWDQGLAEEAEQHYKAVLEIMRIENKNKFDIISTLLHISKIVIENENSSEAVSYLEEAAKYLCDLNDNDKKFELLKEIAKRWEDLGDSYQAQTYLKKALEICETSVFISKGELQHEFYLHVKLGDLVEKVNSISLSRAGESSTSNEPVKNDQQTHFDLFCDLLHRHLATAGERSTWNEQVKNDQQKHYDQAYDLLQRHLATGNLSCKSAVDLLTDLAKKYSSIDLLKSEELVLKAMKINDESFGSGKTNEEAASILFTLSMVELKKENHVKALEFFHRSLRMELEMHASDPFHFHIYRNIFRLTSFFIFTEYPCWEELETMKQQVLKFWEQDNQKEMPTMSVAKADCLMNMAYVCVHLKDYEKAEELNQIAFDIFAKAKESKGCQIRKLDVQICHLTDMTLDYVKRLQTENKPITRKKLLYFGDIILRFIPRNATSRLDKEIVSRYCNAVDDWKNKSCTFLSVATKKVPREQDRESEDLSDFSRFLHDEPSKETGENQDTEHCTDAQRIDAKPSLESEYHNACLLARSILCDSNHSYLETKENSLLSLVKSLSETTSCVHSFIKEAENARNKKNMYQMIVFLELASSQASVLENKAKISKLVGECQFYLQSYRMAAISFTKAADFYRSASELEHKVVYIESLIGLAKSRMLCNDMENALCACEEGLEIQSQLTTSPLLVETAELHYLAVECTLQLNTSSTSLETFEQCSERCDRIVDLIKTNYSDTDELRCYEYAALVHKLLVVKVSTFFRLAQSEVERMNVRQMVKKMVQETAEYETLGDVGNRFNRRLYSFIGRVFVIIGETKNAKIRLTESLANFFVPGFAGTILPLDEIIPLLDAITASNAVTSPAQLSQRPFQQTLELCRDKFLKLNDNPFPLMNFFRNLGNYYVDGGRTEEAIFAYEAGLAVAEHMIEEATDQINGRGEMLLHLANVHRLRAVENTGKGAEEERRLAEKYYKFENGNVTEKSTIHKNIIYANFLCDEGRFEEAIVVLNRAIEVEETLWSTNVICLYSQRVLYGSDVKNYIESHGELLTKMGNVAYTSLVHAYVQLGNKREASKALDRLLTNGKDLPPSLIYTTSCLPHLIGICQKYLLSLIEEPSKLSFDDSEFPLSPGNLATLYYELGEYELRLNLCEKAREKYLYTLSTLLLIANVVVMFKRGDESLSFYRTFLLTLHRYERILDKSFDDQQAILSQFSFPEPQYVYQSLGKVMLEHQDKVDGAIACYEYCVGLDPGDDTDPDLVATLADLYQTKAFTNGKDDYQKWMDKAQECFQKLLSKNIKMTPFVESTFASFLSRKERFVEAISHFEQLLATEADTVIACNRIDIPLCGVHLAREIEARGKVCLPLKIDVYHQIVLGYLKCGKVEKAQESALQMEEYVENFSSSPYYSICRSMLAYTYKETGDERKAMEILKTVLETEPDNVPVKLALEEWTTIEQTASSCN